MIERKSQSKERDSHTARDWRRDTKPVIFHNSSASTLLREVSGQLQNQNLNTFRSYQFNSDEANNMLNADLQTIKEG